ncbi:DUF6328 family protein [Granulicoccus phenolivorans]|uniref:DUF6328 family protein n=1 Tax=Granulicoccus phenolivorans TaxID=266854 RepID=UPI00157AE6EF|nr:DUF6328 family protein [Granulicoccus phenolivorans]
MEELQRGRYETPEMRADRNFNDILQELRVVLTGTQLTSGFLLAVAFQSGFGRLTSVQVVHYLVLVALAGTATLLGMTPVLVHRLHFAKRMKPDVVRVGNHFLVAALVAVSMLVAGVTGFIFEVVVSATAGIWALSLSTAAVLALWLLAWRLRAHAEPLSGPSRPAGDDTARSPGPE